MVNARLDDDSSASTSSRTKKSSGEAEALGRSRGGFSTKVHVLCDALGNPVRFILTPGQQADITQAEALLADQQPAAVLADKGYDSNALLLRIADLDAQAVIPAKRNRLEPRELDNHLYAERNKVERLFNRLKHYRRLATRYDKTARNFLAFWRVPFGRAASLVLLL